MAYEIIAQELGFTNLLKLQSSGLAFDEILGFQVAFYECMGFPPALIPFANSIGSPSYF